MIPAAALTFTVYGKVYMKLIAAAISPLRFFNRNGFTLYAGLLPVNDQA